ncbi:type VI secretion system accessory protein TagJ [Paracoccus broussonetiae]|uniref:Type VI secretion system accessory protein TagJ n=1 Tax=Paracoccus broussonetiae subsp. drimophilus TaxID=3373869 RepID=A0ABW7LG43_9RHOB
MPVTPDGYLKAGDPEGALAALSAEIRAHPGDAKLRIFLFQLLCIQGDWKRAITQLKLCAELDALALPMAQTYREAIICEVFREKVFQGEKLPLVLGEPPGWIALQIEALQALSQGQDSRAADLRAQAFDSAPATSGEADGTAFTWIADADMRLGPVLEATIDGKYYWLPFDRLSAVRIEPPTDLRDRVWMPANLTFANGGETVALIPTRYPETTRDGSGAARMALATDWRDLGSETWAGTGQRLLTTDAGDLPLMDLRALRLDPGRVDG